MVDGAACGPASEAPVQADCKHGREGQKRAVAFVAAAAAVSVAWVQALAWSRGARCPVTWSGIKDGEGCPPAGKAGVVMSGN